MICVLESAKKGWTFLLFTSRSIGSCRRPFRFSRTKTRCHAYAEVPFFQLRTVHLPDDFEAAIQETQVKQQEIQIASAEQSQNKVSYETRVLQAKQAVRVMKNQGEAEASAIMAHNDAYCRQYNLTQGLQTQALKSLMTTASWEPKQLLEYLRIRAVREHPAEHTTIRI